jgi:membrane-associated protease RseP (regulator of RpoE activity)
VLLLAATLLTTSAWGAIMAENFHLNRPVFDLERDAVSFVRILTDPLALLTGLPFSLTLLVLLLAHEFGHYAACRYYAVDASLPYFLPAPTIIGTFGAFIRIRSPIYSKQVLFDVGIAGPLAGFLLVVPVLAIGLAYSKVLPGIEHRSDVIFGVPLLIRIFEAAIFPGVAAGDIYLHPIARAAWAAIFSTALNLLPIGQLDGGHITYSVLGERHKLFSKLFLVSLVPLGLLLYWPWLVWAVLLLFIGLRHPPIFDAARLSPGRRRLGWAALAVFLLCFMAAPVTTTAP